MSFETFEWECNIFIKKLIVVDYIFHWRHLVLDLA